MGRTFARDDFNLGEIEGAKHLCFMLIHHLIIKLLNK
jgi:hypothetical protein